MFVFLSAELRDHCLQRFTVDLEVDLLVVEAHQPFDEGRLGERIVVAPDNVGVLDSVDGDRPVAGQGRATPEQSSPTSLPIYESRDGIRSSVVCPSSAIRE